MHANRYPEECDIAKKSKRERDEADRMRRLLLVGGAATGLAMTATYFMIRQPPEFPALSGAETIAERLAAIGPTPHQQQLTGKGADLVVISDTGCGYCREFLRTGLDPMIRFAEANGLSAAYLSIGFGRSGVISTVAAACMEREGSRLSGPEKVRALFEMTEAGLPEGARPEGVIPEAADLLGASRARLASCIPDETMGFRDRFEATRRLFELTRTPTFFLSVPGGSGRILKLEGFSSAASLVGQLDRAVSVERNP
jgi:hypothetical protein